MKYKRLSSVVGFSLLAMLISCSKDDVTGPKEQSQASMVLPEAPGLIGTFSGVVENVDHTKSGTLTISITRYNQSSGALTGSLNLTGFKNCFTKGIFPNPSQTNNFDNHYVPQRGFGSIIATGSQPGSYSLLYFLPSSDFNKGLELNGITEELAFYNGTNWCLKINPVVLKRN